MGNFKTLYTFGLMKRIFSSFIIIYITKIESENYLMKKLIGQKWFRQIFQRRVLIILMLLIQVWFLISLIFSSSQFSRHINRLLLSTMTWVCPERKIYDD